MKLGRQTIKTEKDVKIISSATVAGTKEQEGRLKGRFDILMDDGYYNEKNGKRRRQKCSLRRQTLQFQRQAFPLAI